MKNGKYHKKRLTMWHIINEDAIQLGGKSEKYGNVLILAGGAGSGRYADTAGYCQPALSGSADAAVVRSGHSDIPVRL